MVVHTCRTVRRPCRVAKIYIVPLTFELASEAVCDSYTRGCAYTVFRQCQGRSTVQS